MLEDDVMSEVYYSDEFAATEERLDKCFKPVLTTLTNEKMIKNQMEKKPPSTT